MGCCIPRKHCISLVTTNKKSTQKILSKNERLYNLRNYTNLNKYLATFELQKYYLSSPRQDLKISTLSSTEFFPQTQKQNTEKKPKNKKKIKASMNRLKNLSFLEVNNCQKYFIANQNKEYAK
jgi:hypothetical protein